MKTKLFFLIMVIICQIGNAQTKTCDTPDDDIIELNTISISKCDVESKSTKSTSKPLNSHYVRRKKTNNSTTKNILKTNVLLFSVVDEVPLFPKCYNAKDKNCFNKNIHKHFANNFHPENASENGVNGRVFIQFTINTNGKVNKVNVRGPKNAKNLSKEVYRVLSKLPHFITGKHKGIPVDVKYSLPLNFYAD